MKLSGSNIGIETTNERIIIIIKTQAIQHPCPPDHHDPRRRWPNWRNEPQEAARHHHGQHYHRRMDFPSGKQS